MTVKETFDKVAEILKEAKDVFSTMTEEDVEDGAAYGFNCAQ